MAFLLMLYGLLMVHPLLFAVPVALAFQLAHAETLRGRISVQWRLGLVHFGIPNSGHAQPPMQSKTAQLFSLATLLAVTGSFDDFHVNVSPADVLETVGRLITSIFWVPLQKLDGTELPADGSDVCPSTPQFGRKK